VVAHSMGGLITRRYIAKYMDSNSPDISQLIMLGTPNAGSNGAIIPTFIAPASGNARYIKPATNELTPSSLKVFNEVNSDQKEVPFYLVAGLYNNCPSDSIYNWVPSQIEPFPNDMVVSTRSAFAIPLNGSWIYPSFNNSYKFSPSLHENVISPFYGAGNCKGAHIKMRNGGADNGGQEMFDLFVKPLLLGKQPTAASVQSRANISTSDAATDAYNALNAIQFTQIQTQTLRPNQKLEFPYVAESGVKTTFMAIGNPSQMVVSLRNPNGQVIISDTTDTAIEYAQSNYPIPMVSYSVDSPQAGTWTIIVEANQSTPTSGVMIASLTSLTSDLQLTIPADSLTTAKTGTALSIIAKLATKDVPVSGATIKAKLVYPNGTTSELVLLDDGKHNDGAANDGRYGNSFVPTATGFYEAMIEASGTSQGNTFNRTTSWTVEVSKGGSNIYIPIVIKK